MSSLADRFESLRHKDGSSLNDQQRVAELFNLFRTLPDNELLQCRLQLNSLCIPNDPVIRFPSEVVLNIAQNLDLGAAIRARRVCRGWQEIFESTIMSSALLKQHFYYVWSKDHLHRTKHLNKDAVDGFPRLLLDWEARRRLLRQRGQYCWRQHLKSLFPIRGLDSSYNLRMTDWFIQTRREKSERQYCNGRVASSVLESRRECRIKVFDIRRNKRWSYADENRLQITHYLLSDLMLIAQVRSSPLLLVWLLDAPHSSDSLETIRLPSAILSFSARGCNLGIITTGSEIFIWKYGGQLTQVFMNDTYLALLSENLLWQQAQVFFQLDQDQEVPNSETYVDDAGIRPGRSPHRLFTALSMSQGQKPILEVNFSVVMQAYDQQALCKILVVGFHGTEQESMHSIDTSVPATQRKGLRMNLLHDSTIGIQITDQGQPAYCRSGPGAEARKQINLWDEDRTTYTLLTFDMLTKKFDFSLFWLPQLSPKMDASQSDIDSKLLQPKCSFWRDQIFAPVCREPPMILAANRITSFDTVQNYPCRLYTTDKVLTSATRYIANDLAINESDAKDDIASDGSDSDMLFDSHDLIDYEVAADDEYTVLFSRRGVHVFDMRLLYATRPVREDNEEVRKRKREREMELEREEREKEERKKEKEREKARGGHHLVEMSESDSTDTDPAPLI